MANSNDWAVFQFFNAPYDPVAAAYWQENQHTPQREREREESRQARINTIEMKCFICCEACKKSVKRAVSNMSGFRSVKVNTEAHKVTVSGEFLRAEEVMNVVQKASKKKTELWPRVADRRSARME